MEPDFDYLKNHRNRYLYVHPGRDGKYVTICDEQEVTVLELDLTERIKLCVKLFYVDDRKDFNRLQISKMIWRKRSGWTQDGEVIVNQIGAGQIRDILEVFAELDLSDAQKSRLPLANIEISQIGGILGSEKGADLVKLISESSELQSDIFAIKNKKMAVEEFENKLKVGCSEPEWQKFFESNPWIFGHGLSYVFLDKVGDKFETTTTGHEHLTSGKRVDALVRTRAEVSQYVFIEIKKSDEPLLKETSYRSGCWGVSAELSNAVSQIQKTAFEFSKRRFRENLKDQSGNTLENVVYLIDPRCYLIIGNLDQIAENDDKVASFELFRRNIRTPEIITYDELFQRVSFMVNNLGSEAVRPPTANSDEIPF